MDKPIVFFSHSSKDKDYLMFLKNKILRKTSNTIEIFQSSDGESIPFGNNWVHKIEDNLNDTKLMFVFISPNSLKSNWIYFESGYSYSKGIKVIPIGINGIDIGKLAPPINLLQGFNITSFEGLNNLITVINREFANTFAESFGNDDYEELLSKGNNTQNYNHHYNFIDFIKTEFSAKLTDNELKESALDDIITFLKTNSIKYSLDSKKRIYLHGMVISQNKERIEFKFDQLKLEENIGIIIKLLPVVYAKKLDRFWMGIYFTSDIELMTTDFKISSRLSNMGIEMSETKSTLYEFKSVLFALDNESTYRVDGQTEGKRLRIVYPLDSFNASDISELITILFDQKLIWIKNEKQ